MTSQAGPKHSEGRDMTMISEAAWLIELRGNAPQWWYLGDDGEDGQGWTSDSLKALRFARKQDAEAYIENVGWTEAFASEHGWSDPPTHKWWIWNGLECCEICGTVRNDKNGDKICKGQVRVGPRTSPPPSGEAGERVGYIAEDGSYCGPFVRCSCGNKKLELRGKFWCCTKCGVSYGEHALPTIKEPTDGK